MPLRIRLYKEKYGNTIKEMFSSLQFTVHLGKKILNCQMCPLPLPKTLKLLFDD